jgi:hypothetical protein
MWSRSENNTNAWTQKTEYKIPKIIIKGPANAELDQKVPHEGSIADYFGIPINLTTEKNKTEKGRVNALPFRGYTKIWNEWFRDQNVDNPAILKTGDQDEIMGIGGNWNTLAKETILQHAFQGGKPLWVNKFHDYFTSALPSPQKGEPTLIPMSGNAPVMLYDSSDLENKVKKDSSWEKGTYLYKTSEDTGTMTVNKGTTAEMLGVMGVELSGVQSATINNLRQAFAVQQFMEADARGGTRYREIISNHFGVNIDDKTVQIPEYLGGQRYMINVSQVVQTSATDTTSPQGNAAAISVTPFTENSFTKSFQEHGYVIGVCCIRNDNTYQQGIERMWSRSEKYDFYWPEFAHLGEQAVLNKEIFVQGTADDEKAFGYQEAYAEYRYKPNRVAGKFRSNAEQPLDAWHYADYYTKLPTLSQDWLATDKANINRTLAVQNQPQFIVDMLITNESVRPMPIYGTPGLTKL